MPDEGPAGPAGEGTGLAGSPLLWAMTHLPHDTCPWCRTPGAAVVGGAYLRYLGPGPTGGHEHSRRYRCACGRRWSHIRRTPARSTSPKDDL